MYAVIDENGTVLRLCNSRDAAIKEAEMAGAKAVALDDGGDNDLSRG